MLFVGTVIRPPRVWSCIPWCLLPVELVNMSKRLHTRFRMQYWTWFLEYGKILILMVRANQPCTKGKTDIRDGPESNFNLKTAKMALDVNRSAKKANRV